MKHNRTKVVGLILVISILIAIVLVFTVLTKNAESPTSSGSDAQPAPTATADAGSETREQCLERVNKLEANETILQEARRVCEAIAQ